MSAQQEHAAGVSPEQVPKDAGEIERAIEARRAHLAATVDELVRRTRPAELARAGAEDARRRARGLVADENGIRVERVVAVAAAVAAVLLVIAIGRRRR